MGPAWRARPLPLVMAAVLAAGGSASARAAQPGPPLPPDAAGVGDALDCPQRISAPNGPVLLIHGTGATPEGWRAAFAPALTTGGFAVCLLTLPDGALDDAQTSAEYVVGAVRQVAARAGRPVGVVGHSQGGVLPRWAIKWWPDIRNRVSAVIGIEATNHGSAISNQLCRLACRAAGWQQRSDSRWLAALNRGSETIDEVHYTSIYSDDDTNAVPPSSSLAGAANVVNIAVQSVCPGRQVDHAGAIFDAAVYAIMSDALTHSGIASGSRIPASVCAGQYAPGADPSRVETAQHNGDAFFYSHYAMGDQLVAEPALRAFTSAPPAVPRASLSIRPRFVRRHVRAHLRLAASGVAGRSRWPLGRARVRLGGVIARTDAAGHARMTVRLRRPGAHTLRLRAVGLPVARAFVRVRR